QPLINTPLKPTKALVRALVLPTGRTTSRKAPRFTIPGPISSVIRMGRRPWTVCRRFQLTPGAPFLTWQTLHSGRPTDHKHNPTIHSAVIADLPWRLEAAHRAC